MTIGAKNKGTDNLDFGVISNYKDEYKIKSILIFVDCFLVACFLS